LLFLTNFAEYLLLVDFIIQGWTVHNVVNKISSGIIYTLLSFLCYINVLQSIKYIGLKKKNSYFNSIAMNMIKYYVQNTWQVLYDTLENLCLICYKLGYVITHIAKNENCLLILFKDPTHNLIKWLTVYNITYTKFVTLRNISIVMIVVVWQYLGERRAYMALI
jgi:hypothetical protein